MHFYMIFLEIILGGPPLLGPCFARGPEVGKFGSIMQLITSTVKDKVSAIFFNNGEERKAAQTLPYI